MFVFFICKEIKSYLQSVTFVPFYHCDDEECDAPPLFVNAEKLWGKLWWSMIPVKPNPPWLHSVPQVWVERCLAEAQLIVPLASRHRDCRWFYPRLCTDGSSVLTDWNESGSGSLPSQRDQHSATILEIEWTELFGYLKPIFLKQHLKIIFIIWIVY